MSGDLGPRVAIGAAQEFLRLHPQVQLVLVGDETLLREQLPRRLAGQLSLVHAPDVVTMADDPLTALRHKKHSSMWKALAMLQDGQADACVSAGNTGALLAIARHLLKTLPGIERPAICKSMPVRQGSTYLLDLGANIGVSALHLHQFAQMGAALAASMGNAQPRVALLNIGVEAHKGTEVLQQAQALLQADSGLLYAGFVEANAIFSGDVDVIVCDGFHGNLVLKASEGLAAFVAGRISQEFNRHLGTRLIALLAWPVLRRLRRQLNPALYNGASLLGLPKTVIKSHGNAGVEAFTQALQVALQQVHEAVPQRIQQQISAPLTNV